MSTNAPAEALSTHLLLPLAVPALQQLDDDILHLLWGVAGGKVFLQAVVADRDLALQGLFFPHDEVDDVIFQFSLATELLEPLGLSQRRGYARSFEVAAQSYLSR